MDSKSERRHYLQNSRLAYKVLLPSLLFVFVFIAFPMFYSISIAFTDYKYGAPTGKVILFKNFIDIFTNQTIAPIFYKSLVITFEFAAMAVVAVVIISLAIALLLNERFRGSGVIKVALLLPYALPGVVGAVIWKWIYNPTFGVLDYVLQQLGIIKDYIAFTADPSFAIFTILFAYIWKFVPYSTFLFTAGSGDHSKKRLRSSANGWIEYFQYFLENHRSTLDAGIPARSGHPNDICSGLPLLTLICYYEGRSGRCDENASLVDIQ